MLRVNEFGLWRLIMTSGTTPLNVHLISCSEPPVHALLWVFASLLSDPNNIDTCDISRAALVEWRNAFAAALKQVAEAAASRDDDGPRRC